MIQVLRSGIASVQDGGRKGYRHLGVPVSGAMDMDALRIGNLLLDNDPFAAGLEITLMGPKLLFTQSTYAVITGGEYRVLLNGVDVLRNTVFPIHPNDILEYKGKIKGCRSYLCIKGGIRTDFVLESASMYTPITPNSSLVKGDVIKYVPTYNYRAAIVSYQRKGVLDRNRLLVHKGPEYDLFSPKSIDELLKYSFTVSRDYNRMGYRLEEQVGGHEFSILTSATLPGTVQYTRSGQLIILMNDGPTTGGYPRIFQLTDEARSVLAQKCQGDTVKFVLA